MYSKASRKHWALVCPGNHSFVSTECEVFTGPQVCLAAHARHPALRSEARESWQV